jgi:hypothetical protein
MLANDGDVDAVVTTLDDANIPIASTKNRVEQN